MDKRNSEFWLKARRARDNLIEQFLLDPVVSMIDLGIRPDSKHQEIVLRIHVREQWFDMSLDQRPKFPDQVEGIPVVVIPGDYRIAI